MTEPVGGASAPSPVAPAGSFAVLPGRPAPAAEVRSRQVDVGGKMWTFRATGASTAGAGCRGAVPLLGVVAEPPDGGGAREAAYVVGARLAEVSDDALAAVAASAREPSTPARPRSDPSQKRPSADHGDAPSPPRRPPAPAKDPRENAVARRRAARRRLARRTAQRAGG